MQRILVCAIVALCVAGCAPVGNDVLAHLSPEKAQELKVWSTNHAIVFDLRIHTMDTCPFLTYLPSSGLPPQEWADFAWNFYRCKHEEEDNCACDAQLKDAPAYLPPKQ